MSTAADATPRPCRICGGTARFAAIRSSPLTGARYELDRCQQCGFVCVRDPRTDFDTVYDERYYEGMGADRTIDYAAEMTDPATVRRYEWRGILRAVEHFTGVTSATRWLDYGCGLGGLVRYVRAERNCDGAGFEDGYAAAYLAAHGIPNVARDELDRSSQSFDVVTAIEVLEHAIDPVAALSEIAALLRPGGLCFLTTGNAEPFRGDLTRWSYAAVPDVHVSFFSPPCLELTLRRVGLEPLEPGWFPGLDDIIRYKVLKGLRVHRQHRLERIVPWPIVARVVDRRYRISAMPFVARRIPTTETPR